MKKSAQLPMQVRKVMSFERALHRWKPWLDSVAQGRKSLKPDGLPRPNFNTLIIAARKALREIGFPPCAIFELYWLCCVYADYETASGFMFNRLILPAWFPPLGFKPGHPLDFKGKRIYPPEIWDEDDRLFWFLRQPMLAESQEERQRQFDDFPDLDWVMILPPDHFVHTLLKKGRPLKTTASGETWLD